MRSLAVLVVLPVLLLAAGCGADNGDETGGPASDQPPATTSREEEVEAEPDPSVPKEDPNDPAVQARRFFEQMDELALALDGAVASALDGDASAVPRIGRLRDRILKRVNKRLLAGGDTSVGGNLLLSAATTTRNAARSGDTARLASQRKEIADARNKLAEELIE